MKTLYAHQQYAVDLMNCTTRLMNIFPTGLGKSMCLLEWARLALKSGKIKNLLIVCPHNLVDKWAVDIEEMVDFEGISQEDMELVRDNTTIMSFNRIYKRKVTKLKIEGVEQEKVTYPLNPEIDHEWDAVAVDEAHGIGAHNSVQTKACHLLAKMSTYHWAFTATPHSGSSKCKYGDMKKLYGEISFLDPYKWKSWSAWCKEYVTAHDRFYQPIDYDIRKCYDLLEEYAIAIRLEDTVDMPEKVETMMPCKLSEKKIYTDIRNNRFSQYDIDPGAPGSFFIKCKQICSGFLKTDHGIEILTTNKDDVLETLVDGTDEPIVIFCSFTESIDRCARLFKKKKISYVIQDGRSKGPEWKKFADGKVRVIICQYQSGGAGLNLQRSHIMILYETATSVTYLQQAIGRIHRIGQKQTCMYYYLSVVDTVKRKLTNPNTGKEYERIVPCVEEVTWASNREGRDMTESAINSLAEMNKI